PAPARKNFSPSSPTAGIRLDLPVRQAYAQAAISPYVLGGTLTKYRLAPFFVATSASTWSASET
ncbi:MAG: hypothetical protein WCB27_14805, partial [Thermoguttaceae bacterium]